jgi:cadmium resistance protein CadD (predicted permease)
MVELLSATLHLYRQALQATWRSLMRSWVMVAALIGFALLFVGAARIVGSLGMIGGVLLGLANALLVGATLRLIEQSLSAVRTIQFTDVTESFGHYFWDVIGVGFVLWLPMMALDMGTQANPYGGFVSSAVTLLLFILLNAAPEVIYQIRHDSPLDVFKASYEFVLEHWIEWFLPFALLALPIVVSPSGIQEFFSLSTGIGRGAGLNFFQLLLLPFTLIGGWMSYVGLDPDAQWVLLLLLTPLVATTALLFRGHLFALLRSSTRRQRMFAHRIEDNR